MGNFLRVGLRRAVAGLVLVAMGTTCVGVTAAHAEGAVFSGACALTLTTSSTAASVLPAPATLSFWSSGTCVINGSIVPMRFNGVLGTTSVTGGWSCAGGVATGTGVFEAAFPGFPNPLVQVVAVNTGTALELSAYALVIRFEGTGVLAGDPLDSATCASGGGPSVRTWTGGFAFQDPITPIG